LAINTGLSQTQVMTLIQQALLAHRNALVTINKLYEWTSGLSAAELAAASGWTEAEAPTVLSAVADGNAEYLIHTTGLPPGSYPQPASGYVYAGSQAQVIGPLPS